MDWIEEAKDVLDNGHWSAEWVQQYRIGVHDCIGRGIEEVRALRKENEDLEQAKQSWIKRAEEENARAERLEKENEILQGSLDKWHRRFKGAQETIERLEKEKAELEEILKQTREANKYINYQFIKLRDECFPIGPFKETPTLRDEFALEFMVRDGNSAQVAYRRADQMMEARE